MRSWFYPPDAHCRKPQQILVYNSLSFSWHHENHEAQKQHSFCVTFLKFIAQTARSNNTPSGPVDA